VKSVQHEPAMVTILRVEPCGVDSDSIRPNKVLGSSLGHSLRVE
jgi:hypothetical protein